MFKDILIITLLAVLDHGMGHEQTGRYFRFDYAFSEKADGWLKFHEIPATWNEARLRCHAEGAVLASPLTDDLRSAMTEYVTYLHEDPINIFTGVHASFSKGDFTSIEGVPLSKIPISWAAGEPDNLANGESCLAMLTQYNETMADVKCTDVFPYVCYKKKTTMVITGCGTHDLAYELDARTGSCYKFHRRGLPWSRAFMTCAAEGGHLAIINSDLESTVLAELFAKNPYNVIYSPFTDNAAIGFQDWGERGTWMTIHGETLYQAGFTRFDNGQPNNVTRGRTGDDGQFCGSIYRSGKLNDIWCNAHIAFICEKKPDSLLGEDESPSSLSDTF